MSLGERVQEGNAALARGAWAEARAIFERELEARESVDALEGLSWAAWWVEDVPTCIDARERAFRLSHLEGDMRRAAMLALWVGDDYLILRGERAIANGWFRRAVASSKDSTIAPSMAGSMRCSDTWPPSTEIQQRRESCDPCARAGAKARGRLARDVRRGRRGPGARERR